MLFRSALAVDDFGTGYSSLSYLNHFPIDILKIDRSFVCDIGTIQSNNVIVSAIIGIGTGLHQHVVAEGVETQAQLDFLKTHHCAEGQGNFFSPPLADKDFTKILVTRLSGNSQLQSRVVINA